MGGFSNQPRRPGPGGWIILNNPSHHQRIKEQPDGCQVLPLRRPAAGLVRRILDDVGDEPGNLPLLEFVLQDFYYQGPRRWLRLHEKGGKEHEMPAHHQIEETIDEYLSKASIDDNQPLFQSVNKAGTAVTGRALSRHNAWTAIRKRARNAGFLTPVGCHTWRATGVTVNLENGGRLEHAQQMAAHESPRTTKLYDRTITIGEVERIQL
jgi:hypothetical protein